MTADLDECVVEPCPPKLRNWIHKSQLAKNSFIKAYYKNTDISDETDELLKIGMNYILDILFL